MTMQYASANTFLDIHVKNQTSIVESVKNTVILSSYTLTVLHTSKAKIVYNLDLLERKRSKGYHILFSLTRYESCLSVFWTT